MLALMMFIVVIIYVYLSVIFVRFFVRAATTSKSKKWAWSISVFIVLWYPAIEPAISYVVYRSYAATHAGVTINKTVNDVNRVLFEGMGIFYKHDLTAEERESIKARDGATFSGDKLIYEHEEENNVGSQFYEYAYNKDHRSTIQYSKARYIVGGSAGLKSRYFSEYTYTVRAVDGEVLGKLVCVSWLGGGVMRLSITSGSPAYSNRPRDMFPASFVFTVLQPSTK